MNRIAAVCGVALLLMISSTASADVVQLADGNSTVQINTASIGTFAWVMDGKYQLFQQTWFYRVGNNVIAQSIDTLSSTGYTLSDTNGDGNDDTYSQTFTLGTRFSIRLTETLTGGALGSGTSDIQEAVTVTGNRTGLHLFQYSDFDLDGTPANDVATLAHPDQWRQTSPSKLVYSETVATPGGARYEAGLFPNTLNNLTTIAGYNLNNVSTAGPGDATWAWQWDLSGSTGSFIISKDKRLVTVPAPGAALLLGLGLGLVGWMKRRVA